MRQVARTRDAWARKLSQFCDAVTPRSQALLGLFKSWFTADRRRRRARPARPLFPRKASRRRARPRRRPRARTRGRTRTRPVKPRPLETARRTRAASDRASEANHHPQGFVDRFGIVEHARHIRIEHDRPIARGRSQAVAVTRVTGRARPRRAFGALKRIGPVELARLRPRCAELSILRRACARTAAGTGRRGTIFAFKTLHAYAAFR